MRTCLGMIAKFIAVILAMLFIVVTVLALLLLTVETQLLAPNVYKRVLAEQRIYERAPALVAETLARGVINPCADDPELEQCKTEGKSAPSENPLIAALPSASLEFQDCLKRGVGAEAFAALVGATREPKSNEIKQIQSCMKQYGVPTGLKLQQGGPPLYLWILDQSDWEAVLSVLLPAAWTQAQTESVLDQVFAYLDSKTEIVKFSLVELKARIAGDVGVATFLQLVRAQPPCTKQDLDQFINPGVGGGPDQFLHCRPPEALLQNVTPAIKKNLADVAAKLPDEAILIQPPQTPTAPAQEGFLRAGSPLGSSPREAVGRFRLATRALLIVAAALLLLVTLFGVRSWQGWLRWWGIPFLIVGSICGGFALIAWLQMDWAIATYVVPKLPLTMPPNLAQAGLSVGRQIAQTFITGLGIAAGIIGAVGAAMLVAAASKPQVQ